MTTVVTGASGTVGRSLVAQLAQAGEPVRRSPATRPRPASPPASGSCTGTSPPPRPSPAALAGAERLHLFPFPETAREVVALARQAGVWRVPVLCRHAHPRGRHFRAQGGWAAANGPFLLGYESFSAGTEYPEIAAEDLRPLDHAGDFR
jgi:uncharacterized protein YbjT (DUF2867 family)